MSTHPSASDTPARKAVSLPGLLELRARGEPIAMLTCYDASFARVLDEAGVDCVLVGDSLGMVVQGRTSTLPVTLREVAYHTECVARGLKAAWLIADLPFGSYHTPELACASAVTLLQAGAQMVKLEGGSVMAPAVRMPRWVATACRARPRHRPRSCWPTRARWKTRARRCWCWS